MDATWYKPVSHVPESGIPWDAMGCIQVFHPLLLQLLGNTPEEMLAEVPFAGRFALQAMLDEEMS